MKKLLSLTAVLLLLFSACSTEESDEIVPDVKLKAYQSGTHNGFFWSLWTSDGSSGNVNYQNGDGGNYSISWSGFNGNFTCGKGYSSGSPTYRIGYNLGAYTNSGGGTFGWYGWTRNPYYEYYVNETWGTHAPTDGQFLGTLTSDGGTYNVYRNPVNGQNIDGGNGFTQIYSSRTQKITTGQNRVITFANHYNRWSQLGYTLGQMNIPAIMVTETWGTNVSGYSNCSIWDAGTGGGDGGVPTGIKRLRNRGTGLYLDGMGRTNDGADVGQWANTTSNNARWNITSAGSGYYYLVNQATNLKLDGYGRTSNGSACAQHNNITTHVNAQWSLVSAGDGYYYVVNRGTNLKLDGYGRTTNGSACAQHSNTTTHVNAQWQIVD